MVDKFKHFFYDIFVAQGLSETWGEYLNLGCLLIILAIVLFITDFLTRKILLNILHGIARTTKTKFDDMLMQNRAPRSLAHLVPLFLTIKLFPIVFFDFPHFESIIIVVLKVYAIILTVWIFRSILKTFGTYLKTLSNFKDKPIDSYIQVGMIAVWIIAVASCLAVVINLSFIKFFTTLGAASAVMLLIFRDTILGFVASIQVSVNDTVRIGDWVTMEKYGADGDVIEINLSTVKVRNFDKTITNIPTYALISDSFTNWRGMTTSDGRRIKRSIILKAQSVRYLSEEDVENLKKIQLIKDYLNSREQDIDKFNQAHDIDKSVLINGRNMTNIGVFRKYLHSYINSHPAVNKDMMVMVRQLAPTPQGFPLEIYCFSSDKRWENYEYIMADIFDHAIAAVPYFDLEIFEFNTAVVQQN